MAKSFKEQCLLTIRELFGMRAAAGDVGIELELEGTGPLGLGVRGWDNHEEGSLRAVGGNARGGCEYVTHGAIKISDVIPMMERIVNVFNEEGVIINPDAHRTSTHIHVNVQNVKMVDVIGFVTLFTTIEPLLFHLCGRKRDGNAFCASSYETGDLPEWVHNLCKQITRFSGRGSLDMWQRGKYASLSTFRLQDLGTLEARCFPHSIDPQEVYKWCTWMLKIRSMACANLDKSFRNLVKEGIHNPVNLAHEVFGPEALQGTPVPLMTDLVTFGAREAYELTRILKRHLAKEAPEKEKEETKIKKSRGLNFGAQPVETVEDHNWQPIPQPIPAGRWQADAGNFNNQGFPNAIMDDGTAPVQPVQRNRNA